MDIMAPTQGRLLSVQVACLKWRRSCSRKRVETGSEFLGVEQKEPEAWGRRSLEQSY